MGQRSVRKLAAGKYEVLRRIAVPCESVADVAETAAVVQDSSGGAMGKRRERVGLKRFWLQGTVDLNRKELEHAGK